MLNIDLIIRNLELAANPYSDIDLYEQSAQDIPARLILAMDLVDDVLVYGNAYVLSGMFTRERVDPVAVNLMSVQSGKRFAVVRAADPQRHARREWTQIRAFRVFPVEDAPR